MRRIPHFLLLLIVAAANSFAADRYVSTTGSNGNTGTLASPYRNIDYAADRSGPGDTIFVRGGIYGEQVNPSRSGTAANRITIKNYANEIPIIDGTSISVGGQTALVDIGNESYITIDGFHIRKLITATNSRTPLGILVDGASVGIEILNCEIYDIRNTGNNGNAHGILIQGTSSTAISDLVIRGNEVRDLVLGNSEALVLNGNVDGFEVSENFVHDCNNLGIDLIGFEGNGPTGLDQARNGVCRDNVVTNISTVSNPAYNGPSAAGIYVDGGRDIVIERNRVSQCDIGIELASEDPNGSTSGVIVRDNLIWDNLIGGIFVGGYQPSLGAAIDCSIVGNTLYENDTSGEYNGEILVQYNTNNLDVRNNLFIAGGEKVFIIVNNGNNTGITIDYNLYYSNSATNPGNSEWIWNGTFRGGFNAWRSNTGQDANSLYLNPHLSSVDLTIASTSLARDAGDPGHSPASDGTDAFGNPRISGNRIDIGAHEYVYLSALQLWRRLHFETTENAGDAADLADPDRDGLTNLMEFALADQDPKVPFVEPVIRATSRGIEFTLNPAATAEIIYQVQAATDLNNWTTLATRSPGQNWINSSDTTISESMGNVIFLDQRIVSQTTHFYRLEITIP
jgi:hypothetical protein